MEATDTPSNVNHLWQFKNAFYLWLEAKTFIQDVLRGNESPFNQAIINEWETAAMGKG